MTYLCIDLKSFYASVECVERGLDPMTTDLVVADPEREKGTICLAVSPSLKAKGVRNRCRVFEIPGNIPYIMAQPRMQKYIDYSAEIYGIYLKYISPEDIHVYSIDESFLDVTSYLSVYEKTGREMGLFLMDEVYRKLGIRATCGVGSNLYVTKIALDILAKHSPDFIAELDEETYRERLWDYQPLTDFWRIGPGISERLGKYGIDNMRKIAETEEGFLYRLFGVDAELLIDHAWGRESCTMADIKAYRPRSRSLSSGQVLMRDYSFSEAEIIVKEMLDGLVTDLVREGLETTGVILYVGYSGKLGLPGVRGTASFDLPTNSLREISERVVRVYRTITDVRLPIRRVSLDAVNLSPEGTGRQLTLWEGTNGLYSPESGKDWFLRLQEKERERKEAEAILRIRERYGKNALLRGMDYLGAATTRDRNNQIGGHKK